jgi:hypothetical protein
MLAFIMNYNFLHLAQMNLQLKFLNVSYRKNYLGPYEMENICLNENIKIANK